VVENVIFLLIYICLIVGLVYLVVWVLGKLGIEIPPMVMNIVWLIIVLVIILFCWRALSPFISGGTGKLFPR
jgi:hypothetical protein